MPSGQKWKQAVIDGYLNSTGRNSFVPSEFLEWLKGQPDHEAYDVFFGMSDGEAAYRHRLQLVRQWTAGLRLRVNTQTSEATSSNVHVLPAYISPVSGRSTGGGYMRVDPDDPQCMSELCAQAVEELRRWQRRYGGLFDYLSLTSEGLDDLIEALERQRHVA